MARNIIVETDIGDDIDDTWALIYTLSKPEFNVVLIAVTTGNTSYKAQLVAGILTKMGCKDIPIAKGKSQPDAGAGTPQQRWLNTLSLSGYTGKVYEDYDQAMGDVLNTYPSVDVFLLGPTNDFCHYVSCHAALCEAKMHILMMGGSVNRGYINVETPCPEYNVLVSIASTNQLFRKGLNLTLLPLDVCYDLIIDGSLFNQITKSSSLRAQTLIENYRVWQADYHGGALKYDAAHSSSILYDLVVPFYALFPDYFQTKSLSLCITPEGKTEINKDYPEIRVALHVQHKKTLYKDVVKSLI